MALKEIAIEGASLALTDTAVASGGVLTITSPANQEVKVGTGFYVKEIQFQVADFTSSDGCVQGAPVPGKITATAQDVKVNGDSVVRKDDLSEAITISGLKGQTTCTFSITVKVDDPGQTNVKGS